jgi:hypothetical protein
MVSMILLELNIKGIKGHSSGTFMVSGTFYFLIKSVTYLTIPLVPLIYRE